MRLRILTTLAVIAALGAMLLAGCGGGGGAAGVAETGREQAGTTELNQPLTDRDDPIPAVDWNEDDEAPPPPPF